MQCRYNVFTQLDDGVNWIFEIFFIITRKVKGNPKPERRNPKESQIPKTESTTFTANRYRTRRARHST